MKRKIKKTAARRSKSGGDANLYPLDPETAIRAIMDAGPHPKGESGEKAPKNRKRSKD
jgi:hypothetical protein